MDKTETENVPGMTPAEGWRLLEPGDVIQAGDEFWSSVRWKWSPVWSSVGEEIGEDHPVRRRLDPDPSAPLRAQIGYAQELIEGLLELWSVVGGDRDNYHVRRAEDFLGIARNAAFGPGGEAE